MKRIELGIVRVGFYVTHLDRLVRLKVLCHAILRLCVLSNHWSADSEMPKV